VVTERAEELRGHAAMLIFSVLIAGSFSFGGRIAGLIDPMALTFVRFAFAAVLLAGLAAAKGRLSRRDFAAPWRYGVLGGLFGFYFVMMFHGLKTAPPVSAAAVFTLTPLMAAGFGWWVMRQSVTRGMAVALAIGGAGALWVIFRGDLAALAAFQLGRGEAIYFLGCVAHALYIPLVPRLNRGERVFAFAAGTMAAGALVLAAAGAGRIAATGWIALPWQVWATLGYLTVFASVASISLLQYASLRLKAAKVMAYTYLTPVFVIGWELVLGGRAPGATVLPGIALTVVALAMLLREGAVRPRPLTAGE